MELSSQGSNIIRNGGMLASSVSSSSSSYSSAPIMLYVFCYFILFDFINESDIEPHKMMEDKKVVVVMKAVITIVVIMYALPCFSPLSLFLF